jgi:hypothetical protein
MPSLAAVLFGAAAVLFAGACRREEPVHAPKIATSAVVMAAEDPSPPGPAPLPVHFPFRLDLVGDVAFHALTLKDVGLRRGERGADDPLLEAIAVTLASAISSDEALRVRASVAHDPSLTHPHNHLACQGRHLYVDLWRSGGARWGYSLWSGCGEADQFAWREIDAPFDAADLTRMTEPLARGIVTSLREAKARGCYRRTC